MQLESSRHFTIDPCPTKTDEQWFNGRTFQRKTKRTIPKVLTQNPGLNKKNNAGFHAHLYDQRIGPKVPKFVASKAKFLKKLICGGINC